MVESLQDLWGFVKAVWGYSILLIGGSAAAVLFGIGERIIAKTIHWKYYRWFLVLFVFVACFLAWRDASHKVGAADSANKVLRQRVADLESRTVSRQEDVAAMKPKTEGLRISQRQVASVIDSLPYAIEFTIQVDEPVSPFGVVFVCDNPITNSQVYVTGYSLMENLNAGASVARPE